MTKKILIVDDEKTIRGVLSEFFTDRGYTVITAEDGLRAVEILADSDIDIALLDIHMPGLSGLEVLAHAKKISPDTQIVIITSFGTVESAVGAIKVGASEYITKPFIVEDVFNKIERLLDMRQLANENRFLLTEIEDRYRFEGIIGTSQAMQDVLELVRKLAQTKTSALITGETHRRP